MKTIKFHLRKRSMALVLVLAFLVLLSGLIVAFLTSMSGEQSSTQSYASELKGRQLAESAVQLVIAQITQATASSNGTNKLAWASQPGMIRTYDDTGAKSNVYKLYSAQNMVDAGGSFTAGSEDLPSYTVWSGSGSSPGMYTDLNQPALISDTTAGQIVPDQSTGKSYDAEYPIVDPAAIGNVQGFTIFSGSSVCGYTGNYPPTATYNPLANPNPAPMPVTWLYMTQNGQLLAPQSVNNGVVQFSGTYTATNAATNPIVGRIAFWTDDETCKLNINTASEGTCFDVPRGTIKSEVSLAQTMPVQNEYQRTPGHPAMTCLSPALGWLTGLARPSGFLTSNNYSFLDAYYDITPRVNYICQSGADSTSQGGTSITTNSAGSSSMAAVPDGDRLYASLDELVFHSGTGASVTTGTYGRNPNPQPQAQAQSSYTSGIGAITNTKQAIEQTRFFLTASSRAPETTLFNTPRIGLWPIEKDGAGDAKDQLIKFCTQLGASTSGSAYYFQRYSEANSGSLDIQDLETWNGSTSSPSSIPSDFPSCLSSTIDLSGTVGATPSNNAFIPRNTQVYSYLQNLTSQNIPGYGGSFGAPSGSKWSPLGRDQVLTECFDQIRSGLDTTSSGLTGGYSYINGPASNGWSERFVVPMNIVTTNGATKGFGRFQTIVEAAIVFMATSGTSDPAGGSTPNDTTGMQAILLLMPFQPSPGMWNWSPICDYDVTSTGPSGSGLMTITTGSGVGTTFAASGSGSFPPEAVTRIGSTMAGGSETACLPLTGVKDSFQVPGSKGSAIKSTYQGSSPDLDQNYPFCTGTIPVPLVSASNGYARFMFSGGNLTIKIRCAFGSQTSSEVYQTINMSFPPFSSTLDHGTPPVPQLLTSGSTSWNTRLSNIGENANPWLGIIQDGDIVRAVQVSATNSSVDGDFRLIDAMPSVPASYFAPDANYQKTITAYTTTDTSTGSLALSNARLGRFADSLRTTGGNEQQDPQQYGVGNGSKYNASGVNNYSNSPGNTNSTLQYPNLSATLQGSGQVTTGIPNSPGGLVATISYNNADTPVAAAGVGAANTGGGGSKAALLTTSGGSYPGDWDSGPGYCPDGPYINKPDPGLASNSDDGPGGYWAGTDSYSDNGAAYSPNRMAASAVLFGSLPTPNTTGTLQPWQTLLFCPNPAAGYNHPGWGVPVTATANAAPSAPFKTPPDYLMLDLFTMPIVEPYAISEPLSTAGKVNLNYQIVPFTYMRRDTAVQGVLTSMLLGAIPNNITSAGSSSNTNTMYKAPYGSANTATATTRFTLNLNEATGTLAGFESKFNSGDIFRSAADICTIFLVPNDPKDPNGGISNPTYANMSTQWGTANNWWTNYQLTGDNLRESPYNQIYPRITTKSNSFTIHYKVQVLKKSTPSAQTPANGWNEALETVVSEDRGSTEIERYVDPSDPTLPDFVTNTSATLDSYYKFRVVSTRRFNP